MQPDGCRLRERDACGARSAGRPLADPDSRLDGDQRARLRGRRLQRAGRPSTPTHHLIVDARGDQQSAPDRVATRQHGQPGEGGTAGPIRSKPFADRGYFKGVRRSSPATRHGITVTLAQAHDIAAPSRTAASASRTSVYVAGGGRLPALSGRGASSPHRFTSEEDGKRSKRRYWTTACRTCARKAQCTTGTAAPHSRVGRTRASSAPMPCNGALDSEPGWPCATRRETVEHPFGTMKARMGATHF